MKKGRFLIVPAGEGKKEVGEIVFEGEKEWSFALFESAFEVTDDIAWLKERLK